MLRPSPSRDYGVRFRSIGVVGVLASPRRSGRTRYSAGNQRRNPRAAALLTGGFRRPASQSRRAQLDWTWQGLNPGILPRRRHAARLEASTRGTSSYYCSAPASQEQPPSRRPPASRGRPLAHSFYPLPLSRLLNKKLDGIWAQQMASARYVYTCTVAHWS